MSTERITDGEVWVRSVEKRLRALENRDLRGVGPTPLFLPTYNGWAYGVTTLTYSGAASEKFANFDVFDSSDVVANATDLFPNRPGMWIFGADISVSVAMTARAFADVAVTTSSTGLRRYRHTFSGSTETLFTLNALFRIDDPGNDSVQLKYYQEVTTASVTWSGRWYLRWLGGR